MQREREVGFGKTLEQTVGEHRLGARDGFFGGLRHEHQRAFPLVFHREQRAGSADPARHVDVVTAAVSHESFAAVRLRLGLARVRQAGFLLHGQRIEFGAHQHRRPCTVLVDRHDARAADLLGDVETELAHFTSQLCGRAHFLKSDLWIGVQVLVERVERWVHAVDDGPDLLMQRLLCAGVQRQGQQRNGGQSAARK
ncbi:hypothetical protein D9M72_423940 [compost metagenome]